MPFINSHNSFYPEPPTAPNIDLTLTLRGQIRLAAQNPNGLSGRIRLAGDLTPRTRIALVNPPPILNELNENAFSSRFYTARMFTSENQPIPISSFSINCPPNSFGKEVLVQVAEKSLSLSDFNKLFTFQIGRKSARNEDWIWETILQNAPPVSRNYGVEYKQDSLTFGALNPLSDRLNLYPLANSFFYDGNKMSLSLSDVETITDENGIKIKNLLVNLPNLNLYKLLKFLIKNIGFAKFETNIPNFEISRADFLITNSYLESLSGILGVFEPEFFIKNSTLYIIDKTAPIDLESFEPRSIESSKYQNFALDNPSETEVEGFLLSYQNAKNTADFFVDRLVTTREETGTFGQADFTRTDIETTYRDWKTFDAPDSVLRTEIIRNRRSTSGVGLILISRETENHTFDAKGFRTNTLRTVEQRVPNLSDDGNLALQTTREERVDIFYRTDSRNPKRVFQEKIITRTRGLVAVDSENQYFEQDFKQDFIEAHKAGNLTAAMSQVFEPIRTVTETLTPLGNNQFEIRVQTVDHLRNTTVNNRSEPKTGDATANSQSGNTKRILILKDGLALSQRQGKRIENFSVGELPLKFAIPLCKRVLHRRNTRKSGLSLTVSGYDKSVERGTFFTLLGRNAQNLGVYLITGFSVSGVNLGTPNQRITTQAQALQI